MPASPRRSSDDSHLRSVGSAIAVLDCFTNTDELGVSEVARRLGVAKSTAHRMLTTLTARGITEQNPDNGRYRLGLHLYELGMLVQARSRLRTVAMPTLRQIATRVGVDVHLSVPDRADVVFLERLRPVDDPRLQVVLPRLPSHTTSSGKAIAAFNPTADRARRQAGFPPLAAHTISSEAEWAAALDRTRAIGFAEAHEESRNATSSLAVPILDPLRHAVGAISVYGASSVLRPRATAVVPLLRAGAAGIAQRLRET